MQTHTKSRRDMFSTSRGGITAVGGYFAMPVIAADRLNKKLEREHHPATVNKTRKKRWPLWHRRNTA